MDATPTDEQMAAGLRDKAAAYTKAAQVASPRSLVIEGQWRDDAELFTQAAARLSSLTPPATLDDLPLHTLWTKAVGQPDYVKAEWKALEAKLHNAIAEPDRLRAAALASVDGVDLREGHIRDNADPDQLRAMLFGAGLTIARLTAERDSLAAFKTWTHGYLDRVGVPHHPPGTHGAAGCRIGDRMDWLMDRLRRAESAPPKEVVEALGRLRHGRYKDDDNRGDDRDYDRDTALAIDWLLALTQPERQR